MANYKRGKCRYCGKTSKPSGTTKRKKFKLKPYRINVRDYSYIGPDRPYWGIYGGPRSWSVPRWHDILEHNRKRRAAENTVRAKLRRGDDPENLAWPLSRKPHVYYW
jgi:hypothetical protein